MNHPLINKIVTGPDGQERRLTCFELDRAAWEIKIGRTLTTIQVSHQDVRDWIEVGTIKPEKQT